MRHPHKWEELLPEEFFAEIERSPIVYWCAGTVEDHGLHVALGTDWIAMYPVCLGAAERTGGIVFPIVPFAPAYGRGLSREELRSGKFELFPPSLWVSGELCRQIYIELMESMADLGFKVCMALGGHGPAIRILRQMCEEMNGNIREMLFYGGSGWDLIREDLDQITAEHPEWHGHGGMIETSLVMGCRPDWVDLSRATRVVDAPFASQLKDWRKQGMGKNLEHIKDANEEMGKRLIKIMVDRAVEKVNELCEKAGVKRAQ